MMTKRKKRRIWLVSIGILSIIALAAILVRQLGQTGEFYKSPTDILEETPTGIFRLGGLVVEGSLEHGNDETIFTLTDGNASMRVRYRALEYGPLPDLFAEGQGAIVRGTLVGTEFEAIEVLAKHDEEYTPREVVKSLEAQGYHAPE